MSLRLSLIQRTRALGRRQVEERFMQTAVFLTEGSFWPDPWLMGEKIDWQRIERKTHPREWARSGMFEEWQVASVAETLPGSVGEEMGLDQKLAFHGKPRNVDFTMKREQRFAWVMTHPTCSAVQRMAQKNWGHQETTQRRWDSEVTTLRSRKTEGRRDWLL